MFPRVADAAVKLDAFFRERSLCIARRGLPISRRSGGTSRGGGVRREALGAFSVKEGPDTNTNGLPDPFETENEVTLAEGDPDLDTLDNVSEYQIGTDPSDSDSDNGGENDGSGVGRAGPLQVSAWRRLATVDRADA